MGSQVLAVALGGAVGSVLRYLSTLGMTRWFGTAFPSGTLLVNLLGCLLATRFGRLRSGLPVHR